MSPAFWFPGLVGWETSFPPFPMLSALDLLLLWLVLQAAVTDLAVRRVPNVLVASGLAIALFLRWHSAPADEALANWLCGALVGLLLFLPFYLLRGMGAGDVKLMAMVGAFVGPESALQIALLSCIGGGVLALAMLQMARWRGTVAGGIPYAVAIAGGTAGIVLLAPH